MTIKFKLLACVAAIGMSAVTSAHANFFNYTISDPYGSAFDSSTCVNADHCGGDAYDTAGMNVSFANHLLNVAVFTNFREPNVAAPSIVYGDLFLTIDGTKYVLDTSSAQPGGTGSAYAVTGSTTLIKAGQATPIAGRPDQDVLYGSGGTPVGSFNFGVSPGNGLLNVLNYSILDSEIGLTAAGLHVIDLLWTMSCANDIASGTVSIDPPFTPSAVPLPGTLALALVGALGMAGVRRRARQV